MSDPTDGQGRPRKPGRGLKIALGLSLAVNLGILGLVAERCWRSDRAGRAGMIRACGRWALALSPSPCRVRIAPPSPTGSTATRCAPNGGRCGCSLVQLRDAIVAEPFDRAAAEAALERSRSAAAALQGQGHSALLDQVETMTAAERAELAGRLSRALRRMGGRDH